MFFFIIILVCEGIRKKVPSLVVTFCGNNFLILFIIDIKYLWRFSPKIVGRKKVGINSLATSGGTFFEAFLSYLVSCSPDI